MVFDPKNNFPLSWRLHQLPQRRSSLPLHYNFEDLPLSTRSAKTFPLSLVPTHTVTDASLSLNSCHPGPISACPVNQSKPSFLTPLLAPLVLFAGLDHLCVLTVSLSYFSTRLVSFIFTPLLSQSLPLALSSPFNIWCIKVHPSGVVCRPK